MEKFEIIKARNDFFSRLEAIKKVINYDNLEGEINQYEQIMLADDF